MSDLKPCPFCGSEDIDLIEELHPKCFNCGAVQQKVKGRFAVASWNYRDNGWISVDDRLPKEDLGAFLANIIHQGDLGKSQWQEVIYYCDGFRSYAGSNTFNDGEKVTNWMPINPPKQ